MPDSFQDALAILAAPPPALAAFLAALPPELAARRPAADAWSAHEVLQHVRTVEDVVGARIRQMLQEDDPQLISVAPPAAADAAPAAVLADWQAARAANLRLLESLTEAQRKRTGRHPRYGAISVAEHVVEWAYHDLDHTRHILAALQSELYPAIGPFQALYPPPA